MQHTSLFLLGALSTMTTGQAEDNEECPSDTKICPDGTEIKKTQATFVNLRNVLRLPGFSAIVVAGKL